MIVVVTTIVVMAPVMIMTAIMVVVVLLEHGFQMFGKSLLGRAIDFADRDAALGGNLRA